MQQTSIIHGLPTTWYPDFYAYNDKTHDIYSALDLGRTGYDFMGWYHGDTKVYDTDGKVVQNVWVDGQQMDKNQLFKWIDPKRKDNKDAASDGITLTARWNPKSTESILTIMVVQAEAELSMRNIRTVFTLITNVQVKPQKLKCQAVQVILLPDTGTVLNR